MPKQFLKLRFLPRPSFLTGRRIRCPSRPTTCCLTGARIRCSLGSKIQLYSWIFERTAWPCTEQLEDLKSRGILKLLCLGTTTVHTTTLAKASMAKASMAKASTTAQASTAS